MQNILLMQYMLIIGCKRATVQFIAFSYWYHKLCLAEILVKFMLPPAPLGTPLKETWAKHWHSLVFAYH